MRTLLTAALLGCLAPGTSADEVRLADGRVLVGAVREDGDKLRIRTLDGENFVVDRSEVLRIRSDDELRTEIDRLAALSGNAPHAQLEIARLARRYGLEQEMWQHLDLAVAEAEPGSSTARRLDAFLGGLGAHLVPEHRLRAEAERKVRALVDRARDESSLAKSAALVAVLAGLQDDGVDQELRIRARTALRAPQRIVALRALARRSDAQKPFVWRAAIIDPDAAVRRASMEVARTDGDTAAVVDYLAPGLIQPHADFRMRTAEAFEALGDRAAILPLVAAGTVATAASPTAGATRAHVAFIDQQSYVRDFDVEIASGAFIADPKIDVVQSGVVLDVNVASVTHSPARAIGAFRRALASLAGTDPGADPVAWDAWRDGLADAPLLQAEAEARRAARPAPPAGVGPIAAPPPLRPGRPGSGSSNDGGRWIGGTYLPGTLAPFPGTAPSPIPAPIQPPAPRRVVAPGRF
ncbi:MAG: hypothetical protein O3C51_07945 [Planctomycetota bacterium]|nr:hypothetical protein [Planctomycetota bacterium]